MTLQIFHTLSETLGVTISAVLEAKDLTQLQLQTTDYRLRQTFGCIGSAGPSNKTNGFKKIQNGREGSVPNWSKANFFNVFLGLENV